MEMHPKRLEAILRKWGRRGWFESGISTRTGWMTPDGIRHARLLAAEVAA
jgi:hypothetical protein